MDRPRLDFATKRYEGAGTQQCAATHELAVEFVHGLGTVSVSFDSIKKAMCGSFHKEVKRQTSTDYQMR